MRGDEALVPFDGRSAPAGVAVHATVGRSGAGLRVRFRVHGQRALRVPAPRPVGRRADRLWQHTCLEAFVAPSGAVSYRELNLAPSGDWNLYAFAGYRDGMTAEPRVSALAGFHSSTDADLLHVEATLDLAALPDLTGDLDLGLCAVLEATDGTISYWALRHAGAQPDFHRRESFVLRLPRASA